MNLFTASVMQLYGPLCSQVHRADIAVTGKWGSQVALGCHCPPDWWNLLCRRCSYAWMSKHSHGRQGSSLVSREAQPSASSHSPLSLNFRFLSKIVSKPWSSSNTSWIPADLNFLPAHDIDQVVVKYTHQPSAPRRAVFHCCPSVSPWGDEGCGSRAGHFRRVVHIYRQNHVKCFLPQPTGPGGLGGGYDQSMLYTCMKFTKKKM